MKPSRAVEIVGGGLAGLSLGLALRKEGVSVTLFEAGTYPRHRVCGEFIAGLGAETIARLGLAPLLADAGRLREVVWSVRGRELCRQRLPAPALALSRHRLDAWLAEAFTAAGGHLLTGTRVDPKENPAGRVFATGRRRSTAGKWLGLKLHASGLRLTSELELHLGDGAYVGLCPVEGGMVNVCGLFRMRPEVAAGRETVLAGYLQATGLDALAARLASARIDPVSCSAVAGVGFDGHGPETDRLNLGDTFAMIPPFTGNGMAMAFQSAEAALDPLLAWARGETEWPDTVHRTDGRLRRRFRWRLATAAAVHPFLHSPARQRWLALAARSRMLPLRPLYYLLH